MSTGIEQPYATPSPGSFGPPAPKKGMSTGCIVGIVAAVVLGGGVLACCGIMGGGGYFAFQAGVGMFSKAVETHPVVQGRLGKVSSCTLDMNASQALNRPNHFVFNIKGANGSGTVTAHIEPAGNVMRVVSGVLKLSTGETVQLVPGIPYN